MPTETLPPSSVPSLLSVPSTPSALTLFLQAQLTLEQLSEKLNLDLSQTAAFLEDTATQKLLTSLRSALKLQLESQLLKHKSIALEKLAQIASGELKPEDIHRRALVDVLKLSAAIVTSTNNRSAPPQPEARTAARTQALTEKLAAAELPREIPRPIADQLIQNMHYKIPATGVDSITQARIDRYNTTVTKLTRLALQGPIKHAHLPTIDLDIRAA
jgi:hypothetical protein